MVLPKSHKDIDSLEALLPKSKDIKKGEILYSLTDKYSDYDADKALKYGNQALEIFEKLNDQKSIAKTYNLIAYAYYGKNDFKNCEINLLKALDINTKTGDKEGLANSYNRIGLNNYTQGKYSEAK